MKLVTNGHGISGEYQTAKETAVNAASGKLEYLACKTSGKSESCGGIFSWEIYGTNDRAEIVQPDILSSGWDEVIDTELGRTLSKEVLAAEYIASLNYEGLKELVQKVLVAHLTA